MGTSRGNNVPIKSRVAAEQMKGAWRLRSASGEGEGEGRRSASGAFLVRWHTAHGVWHCHMTTVQSSAAHLHCAPQSLQDGLQLLVVCCEHVSIHFGVDKGELDLVLVVVVVVQKVKLQQGERDAR